MDFMNVNPYYEIRLEFRRRWQSLIFEMMFLCEEKTDVLTEKMKKKTGE